MVEIITTVEMPKAQAAIASLEKVLAKLAERMQSTIGEGERPNQTTKSMEKVAKSMDDLSKTMSGGLGPLANLRAGGVGPLANFKADQDVPYEPPEESADEPSDKKGFGEEFATKITSPIVALNQGMELLQKTVGKAVNFLQESSPALKSLVNMFNTALRVFFQPFGDMLYTIFRPAMLMLMRYALEFRQKFGPHLQKIGTLLGGSVLNAINGVADFIDKLMRSFAKVLNFFGFKTIYDEEKPPPPGEPKPMAGVPPAPERTIPEEAKTEIEGGREGVQGPAREELTNRFGFLGRMGITGPVGGVSELNPWWKNPQFGMGGSQPAADKDQRTQNEQLAQQTEQTRLLRQIERQTRQQPTTTTQDDLESTRGTILASRGLP